MENWVLLVLGYGILNGFFHIIQKKAVEKNSVIEVLVMFTTISFLLMLPYAGSKILIESKDMLLVFVKSIFVFFAWIFGFKAISNLNVSTYGVVNMSRILFSTLLGIIFLNEILLINQLLGMLIIVFGLLLLNLRGNIDKTKDDRKSIMLLFLACFLNSSSAIMDKIIMMDITSIQLQFWFIFFLTVMYWIYVIAFRKRIEIKKTLKNYWVYVLSVTLIICDKLLFQANGITESTVSVMSLLKQISVVVIVVIGGAIFREKHIIYKLMCAAIIFLGIMLVV